MITDRREAIRQGTLAMFGAGFLSRVDHVAGMQSTPPTLTGVVRGQATGRSEALLLKAVPGEEGPPSPASYDRLPLEWNRATVQRLKGALAQTGVEAFMVRDYLNITYLTGYWHSTTERPQVAYMNRDDTGPWFLYPSLDRDLITTWWFGGGKTYFDFHHADGSFPHEGTARRGPTVDLFGFLLEGIKARGVQGNKIGVDGELYPSELAKWNEILPGVEPVNIKDAVLGMRQVKTPEELALWRRAYVHFDRAHGFARDYLLTHGTSITDYEIAVATNLWINSQLWSDLNLAGGRAHHGVGSAVNVACRVGPVTSYPHPNQPSFNRVGRNMPLQVSGIARIGGYGHENYRMFIIADEAGRFDPHMRRLWEVSKRCCDMQVELSKEGTMCSEVAEAIHRYQIEQGVQRYVYHRPGHGAGVEGHQAPYIALGDNTVMKKNMCFSEEPGLYDTERGVGFNWSDTVVVGERSGFRMSRVPYSTEWCWLRI